MFPDNIIIFLILFICIVIFINTLNKKEKSDLNVIHWQILNVNVLSFIIIITLSILVIFNIFIFFNICYLKFCIGKF